MDISNVNSETVILTPTDILARDLNIRFNLAQKSSGKTVWEKPNIFSLHRWIETQWEQCWPNTQLLDRVHEIALFKYAIDGTQYADTLISSTSTARMVSDATRLVNQYRISVDDSRYDGLSETQAFIMWHSSVQSRLKEMGWITRSMVMDCYRNIVDTKPVPLPKFIIMYGFLALTPQIKELLSSLRSAGVNVEFVSPKNINQGFVAQRHSSLDIQLQWLAKQLNDILGAYVDNPLNAPRIAVYVRDIANSRQALESVLVDCVAPHLRLAGPQDKLKPWRYAVGEPLIQYPEIQAAFSVLTLTLFDNSIDTLSQVIMSPFLGRKEDSSACAEIDFRLRSYGQSGVSLNAVVNAHISQSGELPKKQFTRLITLLDNSPSTALPSSWVGHFKSRLDIFLWMRQRTLSSEDYQLMNAWSDSLAVLSSMDRQLGTIQHGQAISWLREIMHARPYQPRVQHLQPIMILPFEQGIGLEVAHAFILDLSADSLPKPVKLNPFIPGSLQTESEIPYSTPELSLQYGRQLLQSLLQTGQNVTALCPTKDSKGNDVSPSPLIASWSANEEPLESFSGMTRSILAAGVKIYLPDSDVVPPVDDIEIATVRGGVSILSNFARSPFFAFARHRLNLHPFPTNQYGIRSKDQGVLVHAIMCEFWKKIKTSDVLQTMQPDDIRILVHQLTHQTNAENSIFQEVILGKRLVTQELDRITSLICRWIDLEKKRDHPFEVIAVEEKHSLVIERLPISVRLDRMDRISTSKGNMHLVIDYKTGKTVETKGWNVSQLHEPQLPLYATMNSFTGANVGQVDGICFGHISEKETAFHERTSWTGSLIKTSNGKKQADDHWSYQCTEWAGALQEIAAQFMDGVSHTSRSTIKKNTLFHDLVVFTRDTRIDTDRDQ